jgi:hypothetical protein
MPRRSVKLTKSVFTEDDVEDLQIDIAGSFFMNLIGQNMQVFIDILKKIIQPGSPELATELKELHAEPVTKDVLVNNALVPKGRMISGEYIAEVHWVFVVQKPEVTLRMKKNLKKQPVLTSNDFIIYNPYEKHMQINGSHQFCQSHSLYMAYKYYSGIPIRDTNPFDAYLDLLKFWKLLLDNIPFSLSTKKHTKLVLKPIFELNKLVESDHKLVKKVISNFPDNIMDIYEIMKSPRAKEYCPLWV